MMNPKKYKKKPVVIEAVKFEFTEECISLLRAWMGDSLGIVQVTKHPGAIPELQVCTLEDGVTLKVAHIATEGDFIIKGVAGEFYACKPDIFEKTYDNV